MDNELAYHGVVMDRNLVALVNGSVYPDSLSLRFQQLPDKSGRRTEAVVSILGAFGMYKLKWVK